MSRTKDLAAISTPEAIVISSHTHAEAGSFALAVRRVSSSQHLIKTTLHLEMAIEGQERLVMEPPLS
jgi:hypothetical protein